MKRMAISGLLAMARFLGTLSVCLSSSCCPHIHPYLRCKEVLGVGRHFLQFLSCFSSVLGPSVIMRVKLRVFILSTVLQNTVKELNT